jgi:hypothetical protein
MGFARSVVHHYAEHRFTVLFALLLVSIAGHGFAGALLPIANPLDWMLGITLVSVVFSARPGLPRWLLGAFATASVVGRLTQGLVEHPAPLVVTQIVVATTCLLAAGVAGRRALGAGRVNVEHICAALDVYLLAGVMFGVGYWMMETVLPGSISAALGGPLTPTRAIYFSFVVQATLGFGDIVPLAEHAQGVVIVQGVGGQMYLAVLVARLVSLYSAEDER